MSTSDANRRLGPLGGLSLICALADVGGCALFYYTADETALLLLVGLAIAGVVVGVLSLRRKEAGRGFVIASLVVNAVVLALILTLVASLFAACGGHWDKCELP